MTTQTVEKEIKNILEKHIDLKKYEAFVFGSRATGEARKFSDYDIGIVGKKPVEFSTIALIREELEESDLPFSVDIVDFNFVDKDFKKVALKKIRKL